MNLPQDGIKLHRGNFTAIGQQIQPYLEECQVRIPGVCNGNPETSVLAHIRLAGLCGTGIKPPDLIATIACSACHDEIDRRTNFVDAGYAKECALEGLARTQVIWLKEGVIKA